MPADNDNKPMSPQQFGDLIKSKHPQYADMDSLDVASRVLTKYPQYQDMLRPDDVMKLQSTYNPQSIAPSASITKGVSSNQMQESPTPMSWMENETNQGLQSGSLPLAVGAGFGGAANESARAAEGVVDPSMLQRFQQNYPKLYDASVDLAKFGAKAAITGGLGYAGIKSGVLPDVVKTLAKAAVTAAGD